MTDSRTLILEERQEYEVTGYSPGKEAILEDLKNGIDPELELEDTESGEGIVGGEMDHYIKEWNVSKVDINNLETTDGIIGCDVAIYIDYQGANKIIFSQKIEKDESIVFYVAGRTAQDLDYAEFTLSNTKVFIW